MRLPIAQTSSAVQVVENRECLDHLGTGSTPFRQRSDETVYPLAETLDCRAKVCLWRMNYALLSVKTGQFAVDTSL